MAWNRWNIATHIFEYSNDLGVTWLPLPINAALTQFENPIPIHFGGTGADLIATGGPGKVLKQKNIGEQVTVERLTWDELDKTISSLSDLSTRTIDKLSDVSYGTWTPILGGSGGTSGQTYTRQVGEWVKFGKQVIATFTIQLSIKGTITTNVQIQGLPFTVENTSLYFGSVLISYWDNLAVAKVMVGGLCDPGFSTATIYGLGAAGTQLSVFSTTDIANTTQIIGTIAYRT